jgi:hypothetical protein
LEIGKKILYLINVGRPSGYYVAHIMLNNGATILHKQASKFNACPVCYLPVMTFPIAETMVSLLKLPTGAGYPEQNSPNLNFGEPKVFCCCLQNETAIAAP